MSVCLSVRTRKLTHSLVPWVAGSESVAVAAADAVVVAAAEAAVAAAPKGGWIKRPGPVRAAKGQKWDPTTGAWVDEATTIDLSAQVECVGGRNCAWITQLESVCPEPVLANHHYQWVGKLKPTIMRVVMVLVFCFLFSVNRWWS